MSIFDKLFKEYFKLHQILQRKHNTQLLDPNNALTSKYCGAFSYVRLLTCHMKSLMRY